MRRVSAAAARLEALAERIERCEACPRLVEHRAAVARTKRKAYASETYWGRPVAGFGDPTARLLIVGLAPGAHGANRTGRVFTGDRSGEFLYAALHRAGLASAPRSVGRADGLALIDTFITLPVRCVPPDNLPSREEIATCRRWFAAEIELLPSVRAVLALGAIAFGQVHSLADPPRTQIFLHGASAVVSWPTGQGAKASKSVSVFASYHVSQQNTQTGRLTPAMFDEVLRRAFEAARA